MSPFRRRKLRQKILIDAIEDVLVAVLGVVEAEGVDEVDQFTKAVFVERVVGVVLGQDALEPWVVPFDGDHRVVHDLADGGLFGVCLKVRPAGIRWHPEDMFGAVFDRAFRIGSGVLVQVIGGGAAPSTRGACTSLD